ncbi:hypothetical protein FACS189456_3200 [Bacteroidia bacterium]|nr:hypothetical protein FACS189456_3200 [Bacteroidia bacterium]
MITTAVPVWAQLAVGVKATPFSNGSRLTGDCKIEGYTTEHRGGMDIPIVGLYAYYPFNNHISLQVEAQYATEAFLYDSNPQQDGGGRFAFGYVEMPMLLLCGIRQDWIHWFAQCGVSLKYMASATHRIYLLGKPAAEGPKYDVKNLFNPFVVNAVVGARVVLDLVPPFSVSVDIRLGYDITPIAGNTVEPYVSSFYFDNPRMLQMAMSFGLAYRFATKD